MKLNELYQEVLVESLLKEIETYRYRILDQYIGPRGGIDLVYGFNTPENDYEVYIAGNVEEPSMWEIDFEVDMSASVVTNEGVMFRVIHTVGEIAQEVYNQYKENITGFSFAPTKKDKSRDALSSQRGKLYVRFIERQFPQAKVRATGSTIKVMF
jgi:hypothetical protein